ncbi:MAG: phospholipid carrier-dependent glycosyltransferase [Chloroflexi bacterium]|nr:phospholipid carrier-dependent glycosyltransferase [Chloroflexota bacterium]MCY4247994.1 phospholipid carrier-dependent glycosyltransferase [Chloroflexota bacterium]
MRAARAFRLLALLLLLGIILRCAYAFSLPTVSEFTRGGGDGSWYLANGYGFFSGQVHGWVNGLPFYNGRLRAPPLYVMFVGIAQPALAQHKTILLIRLLQCLASAATIWLTARLALIMTKDRRAMLLAAGLMALHPAMIMEPANIATETLYIFFIALGIWLYMEYFVAARLRQESHRPSPRWALALAGLALGLATLTRGASAFFPLALALHLFLLGRQQRIADWRRACLIFLLCYGAMVSTWTLHNLILWDRLVIVSDQLLGTLWRGAAANDGTPQENDALLLEGVELPEDDCEIDCNYQHPPELFLRRIGEIVGGDLAGFVARRATELGYAILQPHGTTELGGTSVWGVARQWLEGERSLSGLLDILRVEGFASKLLVWLFHAVALGFGALGMWLWRKRWLLALPLASFALYTIAAHLALLALPRYLFPIEFALLAFAAAAIVQLYDLRDQGEHRP